MRTIQSFANTNKTANRPVLNREPVPIELSNNEATKRLIVSAAKRVITQHRTELEALAYK